MGLVRTSRYGLWRLGLDVHVDLAFSGMHAYFLDIGGVTYGRP